ncbi:MAG TPA: class I SAM-dependent methyltransferase [Bacteriovoracaceae bacterium]|nr:class I SAM-dependent methyltransferase [Bacteriovoracaceae bacterium]
MNTLARYNDLVFAYQYDYSEGNNSCHGDIEYYTKKFSGSDGKVLELGCGTGRITIPLKKSGVDITGLDHASAMIEIAKNKTLTKKINIPFLIGDATTFSSTDSFQSIFMPYNSLCFINNNKLDVFIKNIKKHLLQDGKFLFDISKTHIGLFDKNGKRIVDWSKPLHIKELNVHLRRKMEMTFKSDQNITDSIYFWEITDGRGQIEHKQTSMQFSNFDASDYVTLFEQNGFHMTDKL